MQAEKPHGLMTDYSEVFNFIFAGDSTFKLVSRSSGKKMTFRVKQAKPKVDGGEKPNVFFVMAQHDGRMKYIGVIADWTKGQFRTTRGTKIPVNSLEIKAFQWFWGVMRQGWKEKQLPETVEFWHSGKCGRCGKQLTDEPSIACGYGPTCRKKLQEKAGKEIKAFRLVDAEDYEVAQ